MKELEYESYISADKDNGNIKEDLGDYHVVRDISNIRTDPDGNENPDDIIKWENMTHFLSNAFLYTPSIMNNCQNFC